MKDALGSTIGFGDYVMYIANSGFRFGRVTKIEQAHPPWRAKNPPIPFIRIRVQGLVETQSLSGKSWRLIPSYLTASLRVIRVTAEQVPTEQREELTNLMNW